MAAVLAGGNGRRLGFDKAAVRFESGTLLEHAVGLVRPLADCVVVVGRRFESGRFRAVEGHPDAYPEAGPLGGIATALRLSQPRRCLIVPCDMPLLRRGLLARLIRLHRPETDATLLMNPVRGWPEPLVGVYAARCLPHMVEAIAAGRLAIWRTLARLTVRHVSISVDQADQLVNLNTPNDLSRLDLQGA